jgi:plastocyanin
MIKTIRFFILSLVAIGFASSIASAGTVKGVISAKPAPKGAAIKITKDQAICGKTPKFENSLVVSKSGGLKNAVVEIMGAGTGTPGKATMAQNGCWFEPHVIAITAETKITVENNDGIGHNFHTFGFENDPVNFAQPGDMKKKVVKEGFEEPEVIKVQCDIHEWMSAWVVVTEGSAIAVTDANGGFTIPNVKPGKYKVKVWHEKLGETVKELTVKDGDTTLNLAMTK